MFVACAVLGLAAAAQAASSAGRSCRFNADCTGGVCKEFGGKKVCGGCKYKAGSTDYGCAECDSSGKLGPNRAERANPCPHRRP